MELKVAQVFISSLRISVFNPPGLSRLTFSSVIEDQVLAVMVKMSPDAIDDETTHLATSYIHSLYRIDDLPKTCSGGGLPTETGKPNSLPWKGRR